MPEAGEVRQGLVWTGDQWVPLKPSAESTLDSGEAAADQPSAPLSSLSACPVCGKDDRTSAVSGFVDRYTMLTTGSATTLGAAVTTGGLGVGGAVTSYQSETESRLLQRLSPPPLSDGTRWTPILLGFACIGLAFLLIMAAEGSNTVPLAVLAIIPLAAAGYFFIAAKAEEWFPSRARADAWSSALGTLRGAFYCERDDVAFLPGRTEALPPEQLVEQVFLPFEQAPRRRFSPW